MTKSPSLVNITTIKETGLWRRVKEAGVVANTSCDAGNAEVRTTYCSLFWSFRVCARECDLRRSFSRRDGSHGQTVMEGVLCPVARWYFSLLDFVEFCGLTKALYEIKNACFGCIFLPGFLVIACRRWQN